MAASIKTPVVVILGATGTGKTKLSLEIARLFSGEIISADSMQIYKGLDIITNKATPAEQSVCPHHLIDYLSPHKTNTILEYKAAAIPVIDSVLARGKVPVIVGGTIYYIGSLLWNSTVIDDRDISLAKSLGEKSHEPERSDTDVAGDAHLQGKLPKLNADENRCKDADQSEDSAAASATDDAQVSCDSDEPRVWSDTEGSTDEEDRESGVERSRYRGMTSTDLHRRLLGLDPTTATKLHPNNRRKIIRALEIYDRYGVPMSEVHRAQQEGTGDRALGGSLRYPDTCVFWLQCDLEVLDKRLDGRVDAMLDQGLLGELTDFHRQYNKHRLQENMEADYTTGIFQSIGFKEFHEYLLLAEDEKQTDNGKQLFEKGVVDLKSATRKYARYQIKRLRRLFFGAAVSQNTRVPVYGLDCTDVSKWDEVVSKPAVDILTALVKGETPTIAPLEPTLETIQFERNECKVCDIICVTEHEWKKHIKSKGHKSHNKRRNLELRKLTNILDEHTGRKTGAYQIQRPQISQQEA